MKAGAVAKAHPQALQHPLPPALRHSSSAGARMRTARWRGQPRSNKSISAWMSHRRSSAIRPATAGSTPALTRYLRRHVTSSRRSTLRLPGHRLMRSKCQPTVVSYRRRARPGGYCGQGGTAHSSRGCCVRTGTRRQRGKVGPRLDSSIACLRSRRRTGPRRKSTDDDLALHVGMDAAEVVEGAGAGEGERVRASTPKHLTLERPVG